MGLSLSHDAGSWGYAGFSIFRLAVAKAAGVPVETVTEYGHERERYVLDWGSLSTDPDLFGTWYREPDDPILYLLAHSDCEGFITPGRCAKLADRLEEVALGLPPFDDFGWDHFGNAQNLIAGLRRAHAAGERLEFY